MKLNNAIARYSIFYIISLSFLTILNCFPLSEEIKKILKFLLYFISILPIIYMLFHSRNKKIVLTCFVFILGVLTSVIISFRTLRDLLPNPKIGENTSIGYAQYFGYPLYLDSIVFFVIVFSPVIYLIILKFLRYRNKKTI
jgi:hypothetical protein